MLENKGPRLPTAKRMLAYRDVELCNARGILGSGPCLLCRAAFACRPSNTPARAYILTCSCDNIYSRIRTQLETNLIAFRIVSDARH
jgi:hypothetical protein